MTYIIKKYLESVVSIIVNEPNDQGIIMPFCIGTGFLVSKKKIEHENNVYLITNKHVVRNKSSILLSFNSLDETSSIDYNINLVENDKPLYSEHPNPSVDIIAIQINHNVLTNDDKQFNFFDLDSDVYNVNDLNRNDIVEGSLVYALGFPMNLIDWIKTPISRLGNISKIRHLIRDINQLTYIIDAQVFPGNSGGPVISRPDYFSQSNTKNGKLIGIVCSYIPYIEHAVSLQTGKIRSTFEENSGLTLVHPVDFIVDVINIEISKTIII